MKLEVFSNPEKVIFIDAEVCELSKHDRLIRAGKGSGVFLLCAAAILPIPVVHLLGVPLSLLLAGFTGIRRSLQKIQIKKTTVECPECKHGQLVDTYLTEWPLRLHCGNCRAQFLARPN